MDAKPGGELSEFAYVEITEILLAKAQGKWTHFVGELASMFWRYQ